MNPFSQYFTQNPALFLLITVWSLVWKGLALWRASTNQQRNWFIAILVLNTLGLVEIVFLVWFVKENRFWDKIKKKLP